MHLVPLVLAIPLSGAALLVLLSHTPTQRLGNAAALTVAAATTALCAYVLVGVLQHGMLVYWMGAWSPEHHVGIGIDFAVDAVGASGALLTSFVGTLVILFSAQYYQDSGPLFNVLLLVFTGAACACFYTGDLFDLFVFLELSNIATFSLAAYKVRDSTALDGAFVFVIMQSVGAFAILFGLTLLEGYTDQLNMATIGQYLAVHPVQALGVAALTLAACGLFMRGAIVPFHFWLADAQSSAPSPVAVLFCAISVELGLYAFARVYWVVFSPLFEHSQALRASLVALGSASAVVGSIMAFGAHHLKRLIAHVTVAHMGIVLIAVGLLTAQGLAAGILYGLAFSLAAGTLLFAAGCMVHRFGTGDELDVWGRGKELPWMSAVFFVAALAAAGLPFVGTFAGRALLLAAAQPFAPGWISAVLVFTCALTGGALLKVTGGVWLGLGEPDAALTNAGKSDEQRAEDESDQPEDSDLRWHLIAAPVVLCACAAGVPYVPQLWSGVQRAADAFADRAYYYAMTVYGHAAPAPSAVHALDFRASAFCGGISLAAAVLLALASLYQKRVRRLHAAAVLLARPMEFLERLHDGKIGDYVTWFVAGTALLGGMFLISYK